NRKRGEDKNWSESFAAKLVPKLRLGTPALETPFPNLTNRPRNRVSQAKVPKQSLGTRMVRLGFLQSRSGASSSFLLSCFRDSSLRDLPPGTDLVPRILGRVAHGEYGVACCQRAQVRIGSGGFVTHAHEDADHGQSDGAAGDRLFDRDAAFVSS